jgi:predicted phosphodiesterase
MRHENLHFMGDIHGAFGLFADWCSANTNSTLVHVGDVEIGFPGFEAHGLPELQVLSLLLEQRGNHLLAIRGNHDNPEWFDGRNIGDTITLLKDNSVVEAEGFRLFCCGGAVSVDRCQRELGVDLFPGEAFGWQDELPEGRVDIVVTHTAGTWNKQSLDTPFLHSWYRDDAAHYGHTSLRQECEQERLRHDLLMQRMQENGQRPTKWFYGHFHRSMRHLGPNGLEFIGLNCGQVVDALGNSRFTPRRNSTYRKA